MPAMTASQIVEMVVGEKRLLQGSWDAALAPDRKITGAPTATEETTSDLTLTNVATNTGAITVAGQTVSAGRGWQMFVSGQLTANSPYTVKMTAPVDTTPESTVIRFVTIKVVNG